MMIVEKVFQFEEVVVRRAISAAAQRVTLKAQTVMSVSSQTILDRLTEWRVKNDQCREKMIG